MIKPVPRISRESHVHPHEGGDDDRGKFRKREQINIFSLVGADTFPVKLDFSLKCIFFKNDDDFDCG